MQIRFLSAIISSISLVVLIFFFRFSNSIVLLLYICRLHCAPRLHNATDGTIFFKTWGIVPVFFRRSFSSSYEYWFWSELQTYSAPRISGWLASFFRQTVVKYAFWLPFCSNVRLLVSADFFYIDDINFSVYVYHTNMINLVFNSQNLVIPIHNQKRA